MENISKSILEMARGAFMERADYEMTKVMANIQDPNTKATAKRKVTITMELTPDENRQNVAVAVTVKSSLATTTPVKTGLYIAGQQSDGSMQVVEMVPNIPGQMRIDGTEQEAPPSLRLIANG